MKYKEIADDLRSAIHSGRYTKEQKLPTEQELGTLYRVSRQTIRQSLSLLLQEGLIEKRQGSGTYLSSRVLSPASVSDHIAIITPFANDATFPSILWDMQSVFSASGFQSQVFSTENRFDRERKILNSLLEHPVHGILAFGTKTAFPNPNLDLYRKLLQMGTSILFWGNGYPDLPEVPCISPDDFSGGYQLANHLTELGHTRIAGIFPCGNRSALQRWYGCSCAMRDQKLNFSDDDFFWYERPNPAVHSTLFDHDAFDLFLSGILPSCTAIVCFDDESAYFLIRELQQRQILVPDQISVAAFGATYFREISPVRITTLAGSTPKIWQMAAQQLLRSINGSTLQFAQPAWQTIPGDSIAARRDIFRR